MSCISLPEKIYFKQGCLPVALDELGTVMKKKKAFIITDKKLYDSGTVKPVEQKLNDLSIQHFTYFDIPETLTPDVLKKCAKAVSLFEPDVIIAVGGKSGMDLGKSAKLRYDKEVYLVAVPTEDIDGSELHTDMVIIDRSKNLPSLRSVFQEMFE